MSKIPNITFLCGDDSFSINERVDFLVGEFENSFGRGKVQIIQVDSPVNWNDYLPVLKSALFSQSLFSSAKMVVFKELFSQKVPENILEFFQDAFPKISTDTSVLFRESQIDKRGKSYKLFNKLSKSGVLSLEEFSIPQGMALRSWIEEQIISRGGNIESGALNYLFDLYSSDDSSSFGREVDPNLLWSLHHEINKLILYANGNAITRESIERICAVPTSGHVFDLVDAIVSGNKKDSYKIAYGITSGFIGSQSKSAVFSVSSLLYNQFRDMLIIKVAEEARESQSEIASLLGWKNPKRVWVVSKKASRFSVPQLRAFCTRILAFDARVKYSKVNPVVLLDFLLTTF